MRGWWMPPLIHPVCFWWRGIESKPSPWGNFRCRRPQTWQKTFCPLPRLTTSTARARCSSPPLWRIWCSATPPPSGLCRAGTFSPRESTPPWREPPSRARCWPPTTAAGKCSRRSELGLKEGRRFQVCVGSSARFLGTIPHHINTGKES